MNINMTFLGQMLSFAILVWFTTKFIWPQINGAIEERQKKVADGLDAAERARAELKDADARVAVEIKQAREQLRAQVSQLAIQGAEKIVQREIDPASHKAMLDQLAAEI